MAVLATLQQDDTSPDSLESFCEKFKTVTGITLWEFKKAAFQVPLKTGYKWKLKDWLLEWYCDDPFYRLTVTLPEITEKPNVTKLRTITD